MTLITLTLHARLRESKEEEAEEAAAASHGVQLQVVEIATMDPRLAELVGICREGERETEKWRSDKAITENPHQKAFLDEIMRVSGLIDGALSELPPAEASMEEEAPSPGSTDGLSAVRL